MKFLFFFFFSSFSLHLTLSLVYSSVTNPFTCRSSHLSFDIFTSLLCKCANHLSLAALYLSSNRPSENLNIFSSATSSTASCMVCILGHPRVSGNRQTSGQICSDVKPQTKMHHGLRKIGIRQHSL